MANGKFERGEIYAVRMDNGVGSEEGAYRPGIVVSTNEENKTNDTVIVMYMTNHQKYKFSNKGTYATGKLSWILEKQIATIDKSRLNSDRMGVLNDAELRWLDDTLEKRFGLGYVDDTKDKEIEDKDAEIAALKAKIAENDAVVASMKMEIEMWQKCYGRCMDMLVETKVSADMSRRMPVVKEPVAVVEEPKVEKKPEPQKVEEPPKVEEPEQPVEINTCSAEDMKRCGCSPVVIENIINSRPYMNLDELRVVQGVTSVAYGLLKHKLCCVPVKVEEPEQKIEESEVVVEPEAPVVEPVKPVVLEKVNINTATVKEIMEHLGIGQYYAYRITGHRNKNGKFVSVEELKLVEGLAKDFYERYGDRCTIGEVENQDQTNGEESEQQENGKVNINTATAHEIHDASGMHINYCYSICGHRKRNGPFRSLEELKGVKLITSGVYNKYKDYFVIDNKDEQEPEQEPESGKVNINTASLRDLMEVGFEKRAAALIVNERKKYGQFRSVDDLAEIPEITGKILRKLRDNLEV